eukprot:768459-Hanusia_phi.AAC.2
MGGSNSGDPTAMPCASHHQGDAGVEAKAIDDRQRLGEDGPCWQSDNESEAGRGNVELGWSVV